MYFLELISQARNLLFFKFLSWNFNTCLQLLGEWSVTVSGTNNSGQFPSDLEMSLKFPDLTKNFNNPSHSDSGLGEESEQKPISSNTISEYGEKYNTEQESKLQKHHNNCINL